MWTKVLPLMADGKILPYLDIPFQHASPPGAEGDAPSGEPGENVGAHRALARDVSGYSGSGPRLLWASPGETDKDFAFLLDWLREARLARVGCFKYENVEGAASRALDGHVPEAVKAERYERFMAVQREVSAEVLASQVGKTLDVLIDEVDGEGAIGRSVWDAPEIDGSVFIGDGEGLEPGDLIRATVTDLAITICGRTWRRRNRASGRQFRRPPIPDQLSLRLWRRNPEFHI